MRARRARLAAEELTQSGTGVRLDHAIHVPEDEICFFVFDAPSSREAALVAERAALGPIRVVEAVSFVNPRLTRAEDAGTARRSGSGRTRAAPRPGAEVTEPIKRSP